MWIGEHFGSELQAAGLGDAVASFGADGDVQYKDSATDAQKQAVEALLGAHKPNKEAALREIGTLERMHMLPRIVREYMLASVEAQYTPEQLAQNPGYQRLKALDDQIRGLRGQM